MTDMQQLQRNSLFSGSLDTVPQKEATTAFDAESYRQLPRRIAPHLVARKVLGEGGTAIVFGAFHTRLKLHVAVKILKLEGESSAEAALRMQREAELCARLDSPRFPRIYDVDTLPDGTPYVVMEEVHGRPLDELLSHGPLELDLAVAIVCEVLEGLVELHAAGVIHRDIKPSNLILEEDASGTFRVRMLDLGIAKSISDPNSPDPLGSNPGVSLTQRGCLLGTPHYMSSEQLMGAHVDQRTDLYAVGVLLYEIISGRLPFQGDTAGSVIAAALRDSPAPLRSLRSDLPEEVEYIVTKAMDRDRVQRFGTASEMLHALHAVAPQRLGQRASPRRSVASALHLPEMHDLSTCKLDLPETNQAWAARALHSVPPNPPKARAYWGARAILAACGVLAGIMAWPTVADSPEAGAIPMETGSLSSPVAAAPFLPALTEPPHPDSASIGHVDLLNAYLQLAPAQLDIEVPATGAVGVEPARSKRPAASTNRRAGPALSDAFEPTRPSAPDIETSEGVSLNSYVEELDHYLESPVPELPENPYN